MGFFSFPFFFFQLESRQRERRKYVCFFEFTTLENQKTWGKSQTPHQKKTIYIASHFGMRRGVSDYFSPTSKASKMQVSQAVIKQLLRQ